MESATGVNQELVDKFVGAAHGNLEAVQSMLGEHKELLNTRSSQDETALGAAAHMGRKKIAEYLLSQGAPLDICTAAMLSMREQVQAMLTADPGQIRQSGSHGIPLMFHAALGGDLQIAEILVAHGVDINAGDGMNTALHGAVMMDRPELATWLISHGASTTLKDYAGKTALDVAIDLKRTRVEEALRRDPHQGGQ
jgi:ankyrin repeat protein